MIAQQTLCIEKAKTIRERCARWAEEANAAHLPILAREFDYLGKQLEGAIANQMRAFRDAALGNGATLQESPPASERE